MMQETKFEVVNVVFKYDIQSEYLVHVHLLADELMREGVLGREYLVSYDPEIFPGIIIKKLHKVTNEGKPYTRKKYASLLFFKTGKGIISGLNSEQEMKKFFSEVMSSLSLLIEKYKIR